jgi:hypothetical protein
MGESPYNTLVGIETGMIPWKSTPRGMDTQGKNRYIFLGCAKRQARRRVYAANG